MNDQQKRDFLGEHLPYELCMLRYAQRTLPTLLNRLQWNVLLESYGVHARSLKEFLANDSGSRNFDASDFIPGFRIPTPETLHGAFQRLGGQLSHLAKNRPIEPSKKFDIALVTRTFDFLEPSMQKFVAALGPDLQPLWSETNAEPRNYEPTISTAGHALLATNVLQQLTTTTSAVTYSLNLKFQARQS